MTSPLIPEGLGPLRAKILETAIGELGVRESPPGSNRGPRIERYWPEWVRIKYQHEPKGPEWCAIFACWAVQTAIGLPKGLRFRLRALAVKEDAEEVGMWKPKALYIPTPGDLFVIDNLSDGEGGKGHIGIVLRVDDEGTSYETIEGNSGNRVRVGLRHVSDPQLQGWVDTVASETHARVKRGLSGQGVATGKLSTR